MDDILFKFRWYLIYGCPRWRWTGSPNGRFARSSLVVKFQPPMHTKVWCLDKSSFPVRLKVFREEGNWVDFRHGNLVGRCDDVPKRHRAQSYARAFQMPLLIHSHHSRSSSMSRQFCQILPFPSLLHQLPFQAPYFLKKGPDNPTSQLLPISRSKSWSGTGKEERQRRWWRIVCDKVVCV